MDAWPIRAQQTDRPRPAAAATRTPFAPTKPNHATVHPCRRALPTTEVLRLVAQRNRPLPDAGAPDARGVAISTHPLWIEDQCEVNQRLVSLMARLRLSIVAPRPPMFAPRSRPVQRGMIVPMFMMPCGSKARFKVSSMGYDEPYSSFTQRARALPMPWWCTIEPPNRRVSSQMIAMIGK